MCIYIFKEKQLNEFNLIHSSLFSRDCLASIRSDALRIGKTSIIEKQKQIQFQKQRLKSNTDTVTHITKTLESLSTMAQSLLDSKKTTSKRKNGEGKKKKGKGERDIVSSSQEPGMSRERKRNL